MDTILIEDLEVRYRVGVPDAERAAPQRLLLCVAMEHPFAQAAASDNLKLTIDYFSVCQRLLRFGEGREWKLIETLAVQIAETVLREYSVSHVRVTVKKFIIPEARFVGVQVERPSRD
jgi:dihydroneopterin aldolase